VAEAPDKPVYLITGSDRPKVDTALGRLRGHFEAESIETVSALEASGDEVAGLCNAGSLFGDARLVIVTEVDGLKADRGRRGGWKAADVESIDAYLASPAPATVLALVAEELKSSTGLWKACAKAGAVLSYDVDRKLAEWVGKRFHERGVRAEPDAVTALIALVGENPSALETEVDKIATWAAGEPVGERDRHPLSPKHQGDVLCRRGRIATCARLLTETTHRTADEVVAFSRPVPASDHDGVARLERPLPGDVDRRSDARGVRLGRVRAERQGEHDRRSGRNEKTALRLHSEL